MFPRGSFAKAFFSIHHTWKWNLAITLSRNHVILGDLFDRTVLMNVCVHITAGALSSGQTPVIFYLEVNKNASDTNHRSIRAVFAESGNAKLRIPKIMEHSDRIPFCVNNIQINVSDPFDFSYEMIRRPLEISAQVEEIAQLVERNEFCSTCLALSPDSILNRTESLNFVRCENSATGCLPQVTVNFASEKLRSVKSHYSTPEMSAFANGVKAFSWTIVGRARSLLRFGTSVSLQSYPSISAYLRQTTVHNRVCPVVEIRMV